MNGIARSDIDISEIDSGRSAEYPYTTSQHIILEVVFGSGSSVVFRVGTDAGITLIHAAKNSASLKSRIGMMPVDLLLQGDYDWIIRERCKQFHTVYLDGKNNEFMADGVTSNEQGVRFDQWLIHHLLGDSYDAPFMDVRLTDATYKAKLKAACDLAGIATDASGWPIQSLENDINNILPWFLLFAAQAGNTEKTPAGAPVSFLSWLAAQGVTDITQLAPAQLVALMREYGLAPGPGFIEIPIRNRAA